MEVLELICVLLSVWCIQVRAPARGPMQSPRMIDEQATQPDGVPPRRLLRLSAVRCLAGLGLSAAAGVTRRKFV